jgi:hypothetical protein
MKTIVRLAAVVFLAGFSFAAAPRDDAQPLYALCGDPCWPEGAEWGCVYYRGGMLVLTGCTCTDGEWACQ